VNAVNVAVGTVNEARPSLPSKAVPRVVVPSENPTLPVGAANPGIPVTVAVIVTVVPADGDVGATERAVKAVAFPTVNCIVPLPAAVLASPE
jgi:hypothetical protein